jgi:hypothetical protein
MATAELDEVVFFVVVSNEGYHRFWFTTLEASAPLTNAREKYIGQNTPLDERSL